MDVGRRRRRLRRVAASDGAPPPRRSGRRPRRGATATLIGRLQAHPDGYAFVIREDGTGNDVYVPRAGVRPAMHGDRVAVEVEPARRHGPRRGPAGRVVRVLERATRRLVGVYRAGSRGGYLLPQDRRIGYVVAVPPAAGGGARDGDLVVAEIRCYPTASADLEAAVSVVLGPATDPRLETDAVIHTYGLPTEFPPAAQAEATRVPAAVPPAALAGRLDLRTLPIVTIDGENARDFDDAVAIEALAGGGWRLTVAVADVSAYVAPGSAIDGEAAARGTSVYFPDRVLPMLPETLSNGICSLNAGVDRLVKTVRLEFAAGGTLRRASFADAVIRSLRRLTYTDVRRILVDRDPEARAAHAALVEPLERMEALCERLVEQRRHRGSIDFDLPEAEIVLDLRGLPEDIVRAERTVAHRIIEEFMLAANEAVARHLTAQRLPMLYRVHESPDPEQVEELASFVEGFGLRLPPAGGRIAPRAFAQVLERVAGRPEERLVNTVLLRSMKQARYAAENLGHFGLATDCYTHFTSPIRRYPDLVVHRILATTLGAPLSPDARERLAAALPAIAEAASRRERVAMEAERDIVALKKIQFMLPKVGQTFAGFVSGVAPFGFFVELRDSFVEGLVHVSTLADDRYEHVARAHVLRGRRRGRTFRLGDPVTVRLAAVSPERRQIDFVLADAAGGDAGGDAAAGRPPRRAGRPRR